MKSAAVYTAGRVLIFVALAALCWLVGLRGFLLAAVALLLSLPASWFLLARQREAMAADIERRISDRQRRKADLRAQLRGEDDPPA